jgi:hypothetical protein
LCSWLLAVIAGGDTVVFEHNQFMQLVQRRVTMLHASKDDSFLAGVGPAGNALVKGVEDP